jgi:hypothetical protein
LAVTGSKSRVAAFLSTTGTRQFLTSQRTAAALIEGVELVASQGTEALPRDLAREVSR